MSEERNEKSDLYSKNLKPFYCKPLSEKEKKSCLPHVLLKSVNGYRSSMKLTPHKSLTGHLKQMKKQKYASVTSIKG